MDARRLAATRAAVLDIEHAKQMLLGPSKTTPSGASTSSPNNGLAGKGIGGKGIPEAVQGGQNKPTPTIASSLFLCLTDPSLGMTWTVILRNLIKRELRQQGD